MENIGITGVLLVLIVALIAIGGIGIRRRQPQLMIIAGIGLAMIVIGMVWFLMTPSPASVMILVD